MASISPVAEEQVWVGNTHLIKSVVWKRHREPDSFIHMEIALNSMRKQKNTANSALHIECDSSHFGFRAIMSR